MPRLFPHLPPPPPLIGGLPPQPGRSLLSLIPKWTGYVVVALPIPAVFYVLKLYQVVAGFYKFLIFVYHCIVPPPAQPAPAANVYTFNHNIRLGGEGDLAAQLLAAAAVASGAKEEDVDGGEADGDTLFGNLFDDGGDY